MTEPESDELAAYDLADWGPELRARLDELLSRDGITATWEEDDLVVAENDADAVETLIDAIDAPDALPVDEDEGGDAGAGAEDGGKTLSDLYVASDILMNDPTNSQAVIELLEAADRAGVAAVPYGLDEDTWVEVRAVAEALADRLGDEADDTEVADAARRLRELVQPLV
jgi:hypothetical protein